MKTNIFLTEFEMNIIIAENPNELFEILVLH